MTNANVKIEMPAILKATSVKGATGSGMTKAERMAKYAEQQAERKGRSIEDEQARLEAQRQVQKALKEAGIVRLTPDGANYEAYTTASGKSGIDCGDLCAALLRPCECPDDVYAVAAQFWTDAEVEAMRVKYAGRNAGMVRMNVGNRLRAKLRKDADAMAKAEAILAA